MKEEGKTRRGERHTWNEQLEALFPPLSPKKKEGQVQRRLRQQ
jgi:hypothetical protein